MLFRNRYNNDRAYNPYLSYIHEKSATDIQKSHSIALPCWKLRFVSGLFLAALGCNTRTHKGKVKVRQVNDPSDLLSGSNDSGYLSSHIDIQDPVAMPPVNYQYALQRLWYRVYNLRLNHIEEDIIIYKDDLVSTLCRLHYHLEVAAANAFILSVYLVILVGMVIGSRESLSLFCLLSELRSFTSRFVHRLPLS